MSDENFKTTINYRNQIFRFIYTQGKTSYRDISHSLGYSMPTILSNTKELMNDGLVEEIGLFSSTGGRRAKVLSPARDARFSIGVEVSKDYIAIVLVNFIGIIIDTLRVSVKFFNEDHYYKSLWELISGFIEKNEIVSNRIIGIGFALPAIINKEMCMITKSHVLGINNIPCSIIVSRNEKYPSLFINDANAAGYSEVFTDNEASDFIYLSLSNYVGGAIFKNGKLYFGDHQRGGEFGHMTLYPHGNECYCGKAGCADAYCSALVLSKHTGGDLNQFFSELEKGNKVIKKIFDDYLNNLGLLLNSLRMVFDCKIVVGGFVGEQLDSYIESLRLIVDNLDTFEEIEPFIFTCNNKTEVSAFGAALYNLDNYLENI